MIKRLASSPVYSKSALASSLLAKENINPEGQELESTTINEISLSIELLTILTNVDKIEEIQKFDENSLSETLNACKPIVSEEIRDKADVCNVLLCKTSPN